MQPKDQAASPAEDSHLAAREVGWGLDSWEIRLAERYLQPVLLCVLLAGIAAAALLAVFAPHRPEYQIISGTGVVTALVAWLLFRARGTARAVTVVCVGGLLLNAVICAYTGGLASFATLGFGFYITVIGWLFGVRATIATTAFSLVSVSFVTWAINKGYLMGADRLPAYVDLLAHVTVYVLGACLVVFFVTGYRKRLNDMRSTMRDLEQKRQEVQEARDTVLRVAEVVNLHFWSFDFVNNRMHLGQLGNDSWMSSGAEKSSTRQQMLGRVHPEDRMRVARTFEQYQVAGGQPEQDIEYRVVSPADPTQWIWVQVRGAVTERLLDGSARIAMGTSIDITARKQAEIQLQEHASRFEQVFDDHPDQLVISDIPSGKVVACNRATEVMLGKTRRELFGKHLMSLGTGIDENMFAELAERLRRDGSYRDAIVELKDSTGRTFTASVSAFVMRLDGKPHAFTAVRDVTAQHRAESARKRSEDLLRAILDATMEGVIVVNSQNQTLSTNLRYLEVWNMPPHLVGDEHRAEAYAHVSQQLAVDDLPAFWAHVASLEAAEGNARDVVRLKDGRTLERFTQPLMLEGERCRIWSFRDITDITEASQKLADNNLLLTAVFDAMPFAMSHKDAQGRFRGLNRAYITAVGGVEQASNMIGRTVEDVFPTIDNKLHAAKDHELMVAGRLDPYETLGVDRYGKPIDLMVYKSLIHDAQGGIQGTVSIMVNVSDQRRMMRDLQSSQERAQGLAHALRLMCDNVPDMIWTKDLDHRYQFVNKATAEKLLFAVDTEEPVNQTDEFFAARERRKQPGNDTWFTWGKNSSELVARVAAERKVLQFDEGGYVRGKYVVLDLRMAPFLAHSGEVVGVVCTARDVTDQRAAEEKLKLASLVLDNTAEAVMITDERHRIVEVNAAFTRMAGYEVSEVIGRTPNVVRSKRHGRDFYEHILHALRTNGEWSGEVWRARKSGEEYVEWLRVNTIYNPDGSVHRHVAISSDITERKKSEELIWSHAYLDTLTHLPNRRMFQDRLQQALKNVERSKLMVALLFIDLDHFKEVNDTEGHDKGDMLLVEAAKRISHCVRSADTVARLGGDEFTVILTDLHDHSAVERVAGEIIQELSKPYDVGDRQAFISASIGITMYPDDGRTVEDLLKCADQAMYEAKNQGRNRYRYFTPSMQAAAQEKQRLVSDMRLALQKGQFELYFQPLVNIRTGTVDKAEGLIRWNHPERGQVSPGTFIGLAETSGLILEIGEWVFRDVIRQLCAWRDRFGSELQISLNVSPIQVRESSCGTVWPELIRQAGLNGHNFILEITEGLLVDETEHVKAQLLAFRDAGIQVAIDDFGTGYSALSYLNKLDIDVLKIDRSFIRHINFDPNELALVEAMVVMAHKLGLKVVAEGVENDDQLRVLTYMGCDYAQGFLYTKPLPAADFERWINHRMSRH